MSFLKGWFGGGADKKEGEPASPQSAAVANGTMPDSKTLQEAVPEAEADEVLPEQNRSLLAQLIAANGISMGMDLSKVVLPTFILEPRSLLEKLGDCMAHAELFAAIPDGDTPEKRMLRCAEWFLTAHHKRPPGVKKPYNPVLGETFHAKYTPACAASPIASPTKTGGPGDEEAAGAASPAAGAVVGVEWWAQQVSHHPPLTASMIRTTDGRVVAEGLFAPKTRFLGNSASLTPDGCLNVFLPEHGYEMYSISWPIAYVRGLIMGAMVMELGGTVRIRCMKTKMGCDIEFVTKGMFTGTYHQFHGTIFRVTGPESKEDIYKIEGEWTSVFTIKEIKTGAVVASFDVKKASVATMTVLPSEAATPNLDPNDKPPEDDSDLTCPWDAVSTWAKVTAAIAKGDQQGATTTKTEVENHQRRLRTRREEKKIEYKSSLFKPGGNFRTPGGNAFQLWSWIGPDAKDLYSLAGFK